MVVTQIRRKINRFGEDPVKNGEDPTMRWKFSFKSGLEVVVLASIPWVSHRSEEKSTDPAKIQRRFGNFRRRFGEDLEVKTHSDFDRPDRCPPEPDPTRSEVAGGWRWVVQRPTRCERVGSGLGTNPTRTDPWTPLLLFIGVLGWVSDMWRNLIGDTCHSLIGPLISSLTRARLHMSSLTSAGLPMSSLTRARVLMSSLTRADV